VTPYPEIAGAACSLVGFAQQVAAALVGAVVGYALGNSAWPLAIALIAMGALSIACWLRIRTTEAIAHAAETLRPMAIKNRAKPADL
jgi:uncharacterized membrane protein